MTENPEDCYKCKYVIPIARNSIITEFGLCDIVDDGQTCFPVHLYERPCLFNHGKKLSEQEIQERDKESIERHKGFEKALKKQKKVLLLLGQTGKKEQLHQL